MSVFSFCPVKRSRPKLCIPLSVPPRQFVEYEIGFENPFSYCIFACLVALGGLRLVGTDDVPILPMTISNFTVNAVFSMRLAIEEARVLIATGRTPETRSLL